MNKLVIVVMAVSLLVACKNDNSKTDKKADYREKDDYNGSDDRKGENADTDEQTTGSWSKADQVSFDEKCLSSFDNDKAKAKVLCPCLFEKLSAKYSSLEELNRKGTEVEGKNLATACLTELGIAGSETENKNPNNNASTTSGGWPISEARAYVTSCTSEALKTGMEKYTAQAYCECMQVKMEQRFPDINEAGRLSESEILAISKQLAPGCLIEH